LRDGRFTGDGDRFRDVADTQPDVDQRGLAGRQCDAFLFELLEALELGDHGITAERQQWRAIAPLGARDDDALGAGVGVRNRDRDARERRSTAVGHRAFDRAVDCRRLRGGRQRRPKQQQGGENPSRPSTNHDEKPPGENKR
jgi:hypothetical protein